MHSFAAEYQVARRLAAAAGRAVLSYYGHADNHNGNSVAPARDASLRLIVDGLRRAFPSDWVLTHESAGSNERLGRDRVWIVDPLDGQQDFIEETGEFSVMIGLTVAETPVLGIVYLPISSKLYGASWGAGAWIEEDGETRPLKASLPVGDDFKVVVPRYHLDMVLQNVIEKLGIEDLLQAGSIGLRCGLIAEGMADLYIHPVPDLKEWDCCAADLILREAGGTVTDCYGEPIRYNKATPGQPHGYLAAAPGVLEVVLSVVTPAFASEHAPSNRPAPRYD